MNPYMTATQTVKQHLPWVGLLSLVLVAVAGGTVYYYQFVVPHTTTCGVAAHRLIFLDAIIHERGGFTIRNAAYLNQSSLPSYSNQTGPLLNSTVRYTNYRVATGNNTIEANIGDNITIYYRSIDSLDSRQVSNGHGFFLGDPYNIEQRLIPWVAGPQGNWWSVTFTAKQAGSLRFSCRNVCSQEHTSMTGSLVVSGCG